MRLKDVTIALLMAFTNAAIAHALWWIFPDTFEFLPLPTHFFSTIVGCAAFAILAIWHHRLIHAFILLSFFVLSCYAASFTLAKLAAADGKSFVWIKMLYVFGWLLSAASIVCVSAARSISSRISICKNAEGGTGEAMRKVMNIFLSFLLILSVLAGVSFWFFKEPSTHLKKLATGKELDQIRLGALPSQESLILNQNLAIQHSGYYSIVLSTTGSAPKNDYRQIAGRYQIVSDDHSVSEQEVLKLDGFLYEKNSTKIKSGFTQSFFLNSGDVVSITIDLSNRSESEFEVELRSSPSP